MIFITGDLHGKHGFSRLNTTNFPEQKTMTKDDLLIICGDTGLVTSDSKEERELREELSYKNFTTAFICGNHDNPQLLDTYPITHWNGGKVHLINDSLIHLMRGQVYTLQDTKIFTMGGAESIDKYRRTPNVDWWPREIPSAEEYTEGLANLTSHSNQVDYVISHDCSTRMYDLIRDYLFGNVYLEDTSLKDYLETIERKVTFKHWFFGHYHEDEKLDSKHTLVYRKIIQVV